MTDNQGVPDGQPKNAKKHARVFDIDEQLRQARVSAHAREDEEAAKGADGKEASSFQQFRQSAKVDECETSSSSSNAPADDDDDDFLPMLPPGFKADTNVIVRDEAESSRLRKEAAGEAGEEDDEFDDYSGDGIPTVQLIPTACEAKLVHGSKPVTAVAFDQQGLRFVSGGQDYNVNVFDFPKMDASLRPDRQLMPCESHVINALCYNANGETLVVAAAQSQLRLLDRKNTQWAETILGDRYLVDMSHTKGHTAPINDIHFNPLLKTEFLTASDDGTLRIWSTDEFKVITKCINKHSKLMKTKNANGKRAQPQCCSYSPDAKLIVAGCDDGSIQMWKNATLFVNTCFLARNAHSRAVTCVCFSADSKHLLSRGMDGTLKMWSVSDPKKPLLVKDDLDCDWPRTDCGFSPRGEMVYTGTSPADEGASGKLIFLNAETFEPIYNILYPGASCIRIAWHARLNQILVGLSDGTLRIYYDPVQSQGGILGCVTRPRRRQRKNEVLREELTLSPLALDMFQPRGDNPDEQEVTPWRIRKVLRMRDKQQRPQFRKPADMPLDKSYGGRTQSGSTLHSYVAQQIGKERNKDFLADTDVRASILRHAKEAEEDPQFVSAAYKRTQPVPIFSNPEEEEEEEELEPVYKMPRSNFSRN